MNTTTKGALAAAAAGALLLGGAGTLAYWTDSDTVDGDTFTAGSLSLAPDGACGDWALDSGEPGGDPFDPATELIVPGDTMSKVCSFTIDATGVHLRAGVEAQAGTDSGDLVTSGDLTIGTTGLEISGSPVTEITEANDGETLDVTVSVTFVTGADNTTQTLAGTLDDIDIVTTQVHD